MQGHAAAAKQVAGVGGVVAAGHHIDEKQAFAAALHLAEHVLRLAGGGVDLAQCVHGTKLGAGHHLVAQLDGLCAGKEHVVHGVVVGLVVCAGGAAGGVAAHGVDLVEGEPVAAPLADALKQGAAVVQVAVDGVAALPAVVLLGQSGGQLIVMDGDERLHAVLFQLVDEIQIELQAFFVGLLLFAGGEDAAPADGETVHIVAHAGHQLHIFLHVVVAVHSVVAGIVAVRVDVRLCTFREALGCKKTAACLGKAAVCQQQGVAARVLHRAVGLKIVGGKAASALLPAALVLEVGRSTAPQKSIGYSHMRLLFFVILPENHIRRSMLPLYSPVLDT